MFHVRYRGRSRRLLGVGFDQCFDEHVERTSILLGKLLDLFELLFEARLSVPLVYVLNLPAPENVGFAARPVLGVDLLPLHENVCDHVDYKILLEAILLALRPSRLPPAAKWRGSWCALGCRS